MNINTSLVDACDYGDLKKIKILINQGANVNYDDNISLAAAIEGNHLNVIKYLLKIIQKTNSKTKYNLILNRALSIASGEGHLRIVKFLIEKCKVNGKKYGNIFNQESLNALTSAVMEGHLKIVKYLVEKAKFDISFNDNITLKMATLNKKFDIVKYLIKKSK